MINRVEVNKLVNYVVNLEKRKGVKGNESVKGDRVEISSVAKEASKVDYDDIKLKVERIKREIENGTYEVSPDKIVSGIYKFIGIE